MPSGARARIRLAPAPLLLAILAAFPTFPAAAAAPAAEGPAGRVVRVLDGDSLLVATGAERIEVRLHGVDAPERTQPYGVRARRAAAELALGRDVRLVVHGRDAYGRTLAEVLLPGGRSLNRELVAAGLAWWYRRYVPDDAALEALEREARAARRGLWAQKAPEPPWDSREAGRAVPADPR